MDPELIEDAYQLIEKNLSELKAQKIMRQNTMMIGGKEPAIQVSFAWGGKGNIPLFIASDDADQFKLVAVCMVAGVPESDETLNLLQKSERDELFKNCQFEIMRHAIEFMPIQSDPSSPVLGFQAMTSIWHIDNIQFMYDRIMKLVSAVSAAMHILKSALDEYKAAFETEKKIEG